MQIRKRISWPCTCSWTVYLVFWSHHLRSRSGRQRDHCCLVGLTNWKFVRMMGRLGLHWGNIMWCFMTHCTISQSVVGDGRTFIIIIIIIIQSVVLFNTSRRQYIILHQTSSSLQLTKNVCASFHAHFSKYFYRPHPNINLFTINLKEYRNIIYVMLRSVNFPVTVTNKRSYIAKRLANDLIIRYERGEISGLGFVSEVSYRYRKEWPFYNIPSKLRGCEAAQ